MKWLVVVEENQNHLLVGMLLMGITALNSPLIGL
jgi:hypothetical protein